MGGGPQSKILISAAGFGSHFCKLSISKRAVEMIMHDIEKWTYLNHLRRHKSHASIPLLGWVIQDIMHPKSLILPGQLIQILLQQNILNAHIREYQINLCPIPTCPTSDYSPDDLQHRRDSRAACDHAESLNHVWAVDHGAFGAFDFDGLPDDQGSHVFGDVACWVGFYEQVKVSWDMVAGDGRVGADNFLLDSDAGIFGVRYGKGCCDGDVLAYRQAQN
jgi:hypothetical protein